jgi:hypothetical protein
MDKKITTAALAALLAACNSQSAPERQAESESAPAAELDDRAAAEFNNRASQAAGGEVRETLPPFRLTAANLGGTEPVPWGTAVNRSVVTAVFPAHTPPTATMQFHKSNGSIHLQISRANGWQFYVECDVRPVGNVPDLWFNWVANMTPQTQARNRATYDPATKQWFFVTPVANAPDNGTVHIVFWAMESAAPPESYWMLHSCDVLPFKMAA